MHEEDFFIKRNEESMGTQDYVDMRNALAAEHIIAALKKRQMNGYYAKDEEEALKVALSLIPEGSSVGWGGSMTTTDLGLNDALREGNYRPIDRDTAQNAAEREALARQCFSADAFIMSTNALTEDGQLVNMDGLGNRVAALIYGPKRVIVIAGMNKVVGTLDAAIDRCRKIAAPTNAQRFDIKTPCRKTGVCGDCTSAGCICAQMVITRFSMDPDRIHVILVNADLGF